MLRLYDRDIANAGLFEVELDLEFGAQAVRVGRNDLEGAGARLRRSTDDDPFSIEAQPCRQAFDCEDERVAVGIGKSILEQVEIDTVDFGADLAEIGLEGDTAVDLRRLVDVLDCEIERLAGLASIAVVGSDRDDVGNRARRGVDLAGQYAALDAQTFKAGDWVARESVTASV